jgi:NAD(P)-dependent dehydrogenase (short-subunit alcohol dehydrogenase family)
MPIVLITGSGRRLGKGLALEFAALGYDIILHYKKSEKLAELTFNEIKSLGVRCYKIEGDVRDFDKMKSEFNNAVNAVGHPDILINNAAIYPKSKNLSDTNLEIWDSVIDINLKSYFTLSKLFAENAVKGSRIINIASLGAFSIWKGRIPYNVSKAGVIQLTKALAKDLAPDISVNSVSPGTIFIPNEPPDEEIKLDIDKIPMKRYGLIKDVFDAVYFFATASIYITGQNLNVDGGLHL